MSITKGYAWDLTRLYCPLYISNEVYSFYINFDTPASDPDFALFKLGVYDGDVRVASDIGSLSKDVVYGTLYNIFCQNFTFPSLPPGYYTFVIYNNTSQEAILTSNPIAVNFEDMKKASSVLQYRNKSDKDGYRYEANPTYKNVFRLMLNETDSQYPTDRQQYRNVTNGQWRNYEAYRDRVKQIESYFFDEPAHEAMSSAYNHDTIYINDSVVIAKTGYNRTYRPNSLLSKAECEVYEIGKVNGANEVEIVFATDFEILQYK